MIETMKSHVSVTLSTCYLKVLFFPFSAGVPKKHRPHFVHADKVVPVILPYIIYCTYHVLVNRGYIWNTIIH